MSSVQLCRCRRWQSESRAGALEGLPVGGGQHAGAMRDHGKQACEECRGCRYDPHHAVLADHAACQKEVQRQQHLYMNMNTACFKFRNLQACPRISSVTSASTPAAARRQRQARHFIQRSVVVCCRCGRYVFKYRFMKVTYGPQ
jgi:hypothetical protein